MCTLSLPTLISLTMKMKGLGYFIIKPRRSWIILLISTRFIRGLVATNYNLSWDLLMFRVAWWPNLSHRGIAISGIPRRGYLLLFPRGQTRIDYTAPSIGNWCKLKRSSLLVAPLQEFPTPEAREEGKGGLEVDGGG
jgi:hypothetical protein